MKPPAASKLHKPRDWEIVLHAFLGRWSGKKRVVGAIATGSRVAGVATQYSDLDVHIILSPKTRWRERGLTNVDGIVIEYFANPLWQLKKYLEKDRKEGRRECSRMLALGKIVIDKTGDARRIQRLAQRDMRRPLPKLVPALVENTKYRLWDDFDDLKALKAQKLPGFEYAYYVILHEILKNYTRFLGSEMWAVGKMWRFLNSPEYQRKQRIAPFPDQPFARMFLKAMENPSLARVEKLKNHAHRKMGGFKIGSWKLRSPVSRGRQASVSVAR